MYFRTEVIRRAILVLTEEEHAGQRRDAELGDVGAQIQLRLDVNHRIHAGTQHETISAGRTRRIQQRIDRQLLVTRVRPAQPELGKARKLLARIQRRIDRQTARRDTVTLALAHGAEIARTEEGQDIVLFLGRIDRIADAESGKADVAHTARIDARMAVIEQTRIEGDLAHAASDDFIDAHRLHISAALMDEGQFERQLLGTPISTILLEMQLIGL